VEPRLGSLEVREAGERRHDRSRLRPLRPALPARRRVQRTRIVSRDWVRAATSVRTATDYPNPYGYFWWIDGRRHDRFYAFGNYGQYVYVDPVADAVIVRLGSDWGFGNERWLALFRDIADRVGASKPS
jgi:CubicO group peptidase (beta-lactamase class C family)